MTAVPEKPATNDLADLARLIKSERKRLRKAVPVGATRSPTANNVPAASATAPGERFADLFRPLPPYAPPDAADIAAFHEAVKGAVPLREAHRRRHPAGLGRARPSPHARQRDRDEAAALQASRDAVYPSPMSWDIGADIEDEQSFLRGGVNPDLLRKLRRGEWRIDAEIDLHHHNQDEAHTALLEFMRMSRLAGWRCVRVIHGKGLSSHQKIPILRSKVRRWLQQKDQVLAYCEPRPHGGGSGAVLVLLRGRSK
ncbi:MAG: Smr/MutS family protein [Burkholderiales bacterium]|nr:Smr/MutS family protein [Burkholderiales bacterium]